MGSEYSQTQTRSLFFYIGGKLFDSVLVTCRVAKTSLPATKQTLQLRYYYRPSCRLFFAASVRKIEMAAAVTDDCMESL